MTAADAPTLRGPSAKSTRENVETILPLLPIQNALLLHAEASEGDDPGFLQVRSRLTGRLDVKRFQAAWRIVLGWHPALRMSIHVPEGKDPLAVIWKETPLPWDYRDIRDDDVQAEIAKFLAEDRAAGLDLGSAPVMRIHLSRTEDEIYELVWTLHHLFVDGWSAAIVLEDVLDAYRALGRGSEPEPKLSKDALNRYYRWAASRDEEHARDYWQTRLAGFEGAPRLRLGDPDLDGRGSIGHTIEADVADAVRQASSRLGLTVNSLIQAAWAATLGRLFGDEDIVFGTTVSGRSTGVEGMERLVGYFANVVPIRIRLDGDPPIEEWLRGLRNSQFEMQTFESSSLGDVHEWSELPGHQPLFETFLVVENFPSGAGDDPGADDVALDDFRSGLTSAYPLTVGIALGQEWQLECQYDGKRCQASAVDRLLRAFESNLSKIASSRGTGLKELFEDSTLPDIADLLTSQDSDRESGAEYVAPRSETERRMAAIWESLLGRYQIGVHDDYFALGGTSLTAVRLFSRIESEFGVTLPLRTLLASPTIAGLADLITNEGTPDSETWECLVPINEEGSQRPLFCIHAGGGNVLFYRSLANRMGADQPVYGLEPVGLDGRQEPLETIPDMARRYVEEVTRVDPEGPYRLVGHCFGGAVALEMAHQLEETGKSVELVTVIDAGLPLQKARAVTKLEKTRERLRSEGPLAVLSAAGAMIKRRGVQFWDGSFGDDDDRHRLRRQQVAEANQRAFSRFEPPTCSAPIVLVRGELDKRQNEGVYWHTDWGAHTPHYEFHPVEADHRTIMGEPAVGEVAAAIRQRLDEH